MGNLFYVWIRVNLRIVIVTRQPTLHVFDFSFYLLALSLQLRSP